MLTNTESRTRQYALRQRAVALGRLAEQVVTIDCDQGQSGSSATDREGFQRLVAEVGLGRAGIVLGLEVSRLARNNADWHRLLELCALASTLICDESRAVLGYVAQPNCASAPSKAAPSPEMAIRPYESGSIGRAAATFPCWDMGTCRR